MPSFLEVDCKCGRKVRATAEHVGSAVRCWNCGLDVLIPRSKVEKSPAGACVEAFLDSFRPPLIGYLIIAAVVTTSLLIFPSVGQVLGFAAIVVFFRFYQNQIGDRVVPPARQPGILILGGPIDAPGDEDDGQFPEPILWGLSIVATIGLVAPFVARLTVYAYPIPMRWMLIAASAVVGWLIIPILLYLANARRRRGFADVKSAILSLTRHPILTMATLLLIPFALIVSEGLSVFIATIEGERLALVESHFPHPRIDLSQDVVRRVFQYDDLKVIRNAAGGDASDHELYQRGVRRGFTLSGTVPIKLSNSLHVGPGVPVMVPNDVGFVGIRIGITMLTVAIFFLFLSVQGCWLGILAAIALEFPAAKAGTHPDPRLNPSAPSPAPAPTSTPTSTSTRLAAPIPVPAAAALAPISLESMSAASAVVSQGHAPTPSTAPTNSSKATATVLIVDGDRAVAAGLGRSLSDRGFAVILAGSASEGLALARGARPDLVVLNTSLPDRSGHDLCREIRESTQNARHDPPVLIAVTETVTRDEIAAIHHSADDFLIMPFVTEALILRLNHHMERRRQSSP